jgi:hypothetical protein
MNDVPGKNGLTLQALAEVVGQLDRAIATNRGEHEELRAKVIRQGDTTLRIEDLTRAVTQLAQQVGNGFAAMGTRQDDFAKEMASMRQALPKKRKRKSA